MEAVEKCKDISITSGKQTAFFHTYIHPCIDLMLMGNYVSACVRVCLSVMSAIAEKFGQMKKVACNV